MSVKCERPDDCPVLAACLAGGSTPCIEIARHHHRKLELCARLESIADTIPFWLNRLECLRVASELVPVLRRSQSYEEGILFPAFEAPLREGDARRRAVSRLVAEHVEDACAAEDITDVLMGIGHGAPIANADALGYMLRAFFEGLRRHIAFEGEHIVPVRAPSALPVSLPTAPPNGQGHPRSRDDCFRRG